MMDTAMASGSALIAIITIAAFVVFFMCAWGGDKTSRVQSTSQGWQKSKKKKRSKKLKQVQAAHHDQASKETVSPVDLNLGASIISDIEAPLPPPSLTSSDSNEHCNKKLKKTQGAHQNQINNDVITREELHVEASVDPDVEVPSSLRRATALDSNHPHHRDVLSKIEVKVQCEDSEAGSSCGDVREERDVACLSHALDVEDRENAMELVVACNDEDELDIYRDNGLGLQPRVAMSQGMGQDLHICGACANSGTNSWGCSLHRTYTSALLLAHRELRFGAAQSPIDLNLRLATMHRLDVM